MTNGDKIRQMTDKEIADFCCTTCPPGDNLYELCFHDPETINSDPQTCKRCWIKWLGQEVQEDE